MAVLLLLAILLLLLLAIMLLLLLISILLLATIRLPMLVLWIGTSRAGRARATATKHRRKSVHGRVRWGVSVAVSLRLRHLILPEGCET